MEEKKKGNSGLIVLVIILLLVCIGMGAYIFINKDKLTAKEETTETEKNSNKSENKQNSEQKVSELDLSKCLNNKEMNYSNPIEATTSVGLTPTVDEGKRSVTIKTDGSKFGPISTLSSYYSGEYKMYVDGFDKNISAVYVGEFGQDPKGTTLLYVMEDGTVEYTKIFKKESNPDGGQNYTLNTYQQGENNYRFHVDGSINGVNGVIKIYNVDRTASTGSRTAIGATKDGSFYDLSLIN